MRRSNLNLGPRLILLVVLAFIPAAGLVALLATGRGTAEVLNYVAFVGMLMLAAAWAGGNLFINRSLKVLVAATRRIAAGDFTARVDNADTSTEVGHLGGLFNEVAQTLQFHVTAAQKQAETLRRQAETLRAQARLLDLAHDAILVRGTDGVITYWNRAAEELYGWTAEEAVGRRAADLLRYESATGSPLAEIEQMLFTDGRWEGELVHVAREGLPVWVSSRWTLERDDAGNPVRVLELNSNIGDRKRTEDVVRATSADLERRVLARTDELAQANHRLQAEIADRVRTEEELRKAIEATKAAGQAKSTFLAGMSHELRTPLNGVVGMLELLRGTPLTSQQAKYVSVAGTSAQSLLDLISDILDFSKLEAQRIELEAAPFDVREVVESLVETFAPRAGQKGLELACQFTPDLPRAVRGDAHRLRQVLNNLLSNAVKFTAKGRVTVRAALDREINSHLLVRFAVTDSGIGMSREGIDRLFQPFVQADSSTTRKFGGTGLGLAITKGLVELMGGQVEVESEPGVGTTFTVTLVLEKEAAGPGQPEYSGVPEAVRRLRVLIADANPAAAAALREQLQTWGLESETVADAPAAASRLRAEAAAGWPFGLAVVDRHLAGSGTGAEGAGTADGAASAGGAMELAAAVRGGDVRGLPLLLAVPMDESADPAEWKARGFAGCVSRPLLPSRLLDAITAAVAPKAGHGPAGPPAGQAAQVNPSRGPLLLARAKGRRVLLAEDNEINQLVATEILSRSGIRCDVVGTGRAAVDAVAAGGYDLVLMDCQMPEMDGFEASRLIRQREAREAAGRQGELRQAAAQLSSAPSSSPSRAGLPIVALTANAIKGDRERCLAAGMDGYLTKPINPTKLIETILSFLPEAPAAGPSGADETNPEAAVAAAPHPATEPAWTAPAGPPVVDLAAVMTRCLNNAGLVAKLLAKFDGQLRQDVDALEKRLAAGDGGEESVRLAHGLKGVAASMAADGVRRAAAEAEQRLRQGDVAGARQSVAVLKQEAQRCLDGLPAVQARAAALAPPPARAKAS